MNIHTPQRGENETFAEYQLRREASRERVKRLTKGPTQAPALPLSIPNWVHWWAGQHYASKPRKMRRLFVRAAGGIRQYKKIRQIDERD